MAKTNFFEGLEFLKIKGSIKMAMSISPEGIWTGSIMVIDPEIKDVSMKQIIPLNFSGTSQDLGEVFFESLKGPVEVLQAGFTNIKAVQTSMEAATKLAKETQTKTASPTKTAPTLPARYVKAMTKVKGHQDNKQYRQAMAALPSVVEFPQLITEIEAKKKELMRLIGGFGFEDETSSPSSALPEDKSPEEEGGEDEDENGGEEGEEGEEDGDPE